jgi:hypothetical protein
MKFKTLLTTSILKTLEFIQLYDAGNLPLEFNVPELETLSALTMTFINYFI